MFSKAATTMGQHHAPMMAGNDRQIVPTPITTSRHESGSSSSPSAIGSATTGPQLPSGHAASAMGSAKARWGSSSSLVGIVVTNMSTTKTNFEHFTR